VTISTNLTEFYNRLILTELNWLTDYRSIIELYNS
jgi:hypothetical protein